MDYMKNYNKEQIASKVDLALKNIPSHLQVLFDNEKLLPKIKLLQALSPQVRNGYFYAGTFAVFQGKIVDRTFLTNFVFVLRKIRINYCLWENHKMIQDFGQDSTLYDEKLLQSDSLPKNQRIIKHTSFVGYYFDEKIENAFPVILQVSPASSLFIEKIILWDSKLKKGSTGIYQISSKYNSNGEFSFDDWVVDFIAGDLETKQNN